MDDRIGAPGTRSTVSRLTERARRNLALRDRAGPASLEEATEDDPGSRDAGKEEPDPGPLRRAQRCDRRPRNPRVHPDFIPIGAFRLNMVDRLFGGFSPTRPKCLAATNVPRLVSAVIVECK